MPAGSIVVDPIEIIKVLPRGGDKPVKKYKVNSTYWSRTTYLMSSDRFAYKSRPTKGLRVLRASTVIMNYSGSYPTSFMSFSRICRHITRLKSL